MDALWARLRSKIKALGAEGELGPPARDESLVAAEALMGVGLPGDLRESLSIHNGDAIRKVEGGWQSDGPFADLELLSLAAMVSEWQTWMDDTRDGGLVPVAEGPVHAMFWNPKWIPITVLGGSSWHHCVDLDPPTSGTFGQVIEITDDDGLRRVVAPSFRAFLEGILRDLDADRYELDDDRRLVARETADPDR
ncbi:MAG: SMI1/KNR4 family protein [Polyangiaceae bacterium]|jgi:cell wall assembly regulator SMI1|nr:SMI1/KNR4 family protein [Polyangiaceae bacterium]